MNRPFSPSTSRRNSGRHQRPVPAAVLIVPQQGIYERGSGKIHCEYHDRDVQVEQMLSVPRVMRDWALDILALSGGHTQKSVPHLTEADGAQELLRDLNILVEMPEVRLVLDRNSLDSRDNLVFSLMEARKVIGQSPIGRIVVLSAWQFKKARFMLTANALGIAEQAYFIGVRNHEAANAGEKALNGELAQLQKMLDSDDPLLMGPEWESKRHARYQGTDYSGRLASLRTDFPGCFAALDRMLHAGSSACALPELQAAFRQEVIQPSVVPVALVA